MNNETKSLGYVETEVEAAKKAVLAVYPKAEAMRTTAYEHKMWYVSTPAQGHKAGGRLSDYRLTEDGAWISAARHPYFSKLDDPQPDTPKPVEPAVAAQPAEVEAGERLPPLPNWSVDQLRAAYREMCREAFQGFYLLAKNHRERQLRSALDDNKRLRGLLREYMSAYICDHNSLYERCKAAVAGK